MTNYFLRSDTASRYAEARPELNADFNVRLLHRTGPLDRVLDVGCGTGISSRALLPVAREVHGIDPSWAMLSHARPSSEISYCLGLAESLPYAPASFDLIGVGLAIHWVDRDVFLREASRVLRPAGWIFIANTWFGGTICDVPEFATWMREVYLPRYPIPPRNQASFASEALQPFGFEVVDQWEIGRDVPMSDARLASYFTTQSNVSAALERTGESIESATDWLLSELQPFFDRSERLVPFGGAATLLRRSCAHRDLFLVGHPAGGDS